MVALRLALIAALAGTACSSAPRPAALSGGETCAHCRMVVSDARVAAQVAAPGEEALFYDDIGCLARAIAGGQPADSAYVADHRTGDWVKATTAVFTHVPALATPMGSHLIAHATEESRRADSAAAGKPMTFADVLASVSRTGRMGRLRPSRSAVSRNEGFGQRATAGHRGAPGARGRGSHDVG
jgi:copper chaperone NosL